MNTTATKNGDIFVLHHNGTYFNHFPINVDGYIESSPAIGDIDNDGDYELAVATTNGLKVVDIKTVSGNQISWKMHRGNPYRTGLFTLLPLSIENKNIKTNPEIFSVTPNFPNPFNPTTQIRYELPEDVLVSIVIYDVMGRNIRTLMNVKQTAGYHSIHWDAKNDMGEGVSAGMYIYTIQAGEFRATKKMVLLK